MMSMQLFIGLCFVLVVGVSSRVTLSGTNGVGDDASVEKLLRDLGIFSENPEVQRLARQRFCNSTQTIPAKEGTIQIKESGGGVDGNGGDLTIACNFSYSDFPEMARVVSLTLSRSSKVDGPFTDLISITSFDLDNVTESKEFSGTSSGQILPKGQYSYLTASLSNPSWKDAGVYKCEVNGIDLFGHNLRGETRLNVTTKHPECRPLVEKLQDLQEKVNGCENSGTGRFRTLAAFAVEESSGLAGITGVFNSESFYVWTRGGESLQEAKYRCAQFGGYLAEINSEEEFLFINKTLSHPDIQLPSYVQTLVTGAFYREISAPFEFYTHPGDPMYLGYWATSNPDRDNIRNNWLALYYDNGRLFMVDTAVKASFTSHLCEIHL